MVSCRPSIRVTLRKPLSFESGRASNTRTGFLFKGWGYSPMAVSRDRKSGSAPAHPTLHGICSFILLAKIAKSAHSVIFLTARRGLSQTLAPIPPHRPYPWHNSCYSADHPSELYAHNISYMQLHVLTPQQLNPIAPFVSVNKRETLVFWRSAEVWRERRRVCDNLAQRVNLTQLDTRRETLI